MNIIDTRPLLQRAKTFVSSSGAWSRRVVKQQLPEPHCVTSSVVWEKVDNKKLLKPGAVTGMTVRTYHLQHSAVESSHFELGDVSVIAAEQNLLQNLVWLWESMFETALWNNIENRVVLSHGYFGEFCGDALTLCVPRRSLFGRRVNAFRRTQDGHTVLNSKYSRCPKQYIEFHPDIVHFQFPDLDNWVGEIVYRELQTPVGIRRFYRAIAKVAAKPVRTDLGRAVTVLPRGLRGFIYKWVWTLLRIKP